MAKKKKDKNEDFELLSAQQLQELQNLMHDMLSLAKDVRDEYAEDMTDNEISSSFEEIIQITENSPFLDETFKGDEWRSVLKSLGEPVKRQKDDTE
jgi:hypothetical protein